MLQIHLNPADADKLFNIQNSIKQHNVLEPCLIVSDIDSSQREKLSKRTSMICKIYVESITNMCLDTKSIQSCEIHTLSAAMAIDKEDSVKAQMT